LLPFSTHTVKSTHVVPDGQSSFVSHARAHAEHDEDDATNIAIATHTTNATSAARDIRGC
jgi:hypothetical protein